MSSIDEYEYPVNVTGEFPRIIVVGQIFETKGKKYRITQKWFSQGTCSAFEFVEHDRQNAKVHQVDGQKMYQMKEKKKIKFL